MIDLDLSELDSFVRKLEGMDEDVVDGIVDGAGRRTAAYMQTVARLKVHVGTHRPDGTPYHGGELRRSIEASDSLYVDRDGPLEAVFGIRSRCPHAVFEEYGVGPMGDAGVPHTSRRTWWYYDREADRFIMARTRPGHPFMRPALELSRPILMRELEGAVRGAWEGLA